MSEIDNKYNCKYCDKNFASNQSKTRHLKICKISIKFVEENKIIIEENAFLKEEKNELNNDIEKLKLKISNLESQIEIYKSQLNNQPPQTVNNINTINITNNYRNKIKVNFDLSDKDTLNEIENKIISAINKTHVLEGQKGIADLVIQNVLVDENGKNNKYICTDISRGNFKYKDKEGKIKNDKGGRKLRDITYKSVKEPFNKIASEYLENEKEDEIKNERITNATRDFKKISSETNPTFNRLIHDNHEK